jgi:rod shape-determining protein MreD
VDHLLTLPFSALGAVLAALLDTTVLAGAGPGRISLDLVLLLAVLATLLVSVQDGLVWAVVGGLFTDALTPARPLGATALTLLLVVGAAILTSHLVAQHRKSTAVLAVFGLSWLYHLLLLGVLLIIEGVSFGRFEPSLVLLSAIINAVIAIPFAVALDAAVQRFASATRADW